MITIESKEIFGASKKVVWEYLTNLENQNWRKNISYIETNHDGSEYIEHTGDEGDMKFKVVTFRYGEEYEVSFENENMEGVWHGELTDSENGGCILSVNVSAEAKRAVYKPYMKAFAAKQVKDHLIYLKKALGEEKASDDSRFSGFNNISLAVVVGLITGGISRSIAAGAGSFVITLIVLYMVKYFGKH